MNKKHCLTLQLDDPSWNLLNAVKEASGCTTKTQTIRQALFLLQLYYDTKKSGGKMLTRDDEGEEVGIFIS